MSLKGFIQNHVVNPTVVSRGEINHRLGVVIKADEANNVCTVTYVDKDGVESNIDNVPVRIYSPSFQDWFPEIDDVVSIEEVKGYPVITGLPEWSYGTNIRGENDLESDILCDIMSCDTEGGYIY